MLFEGLGRATTPQHWEDQGDDCGGFNRNKAHLCPVSDHRVDAVVVQSYKDLGVDKKLQWFSNTGAKGRPT